MPIYYTVTKYAIKNEVVEEVVKMGVTDAVAVDHLTLVYLVIQLPEREWVPDLYTPPSLSLPSR